MPGEIEPELLEPELDIETENYPADFGSRSGVPIPHGWTDDKHPYKMEPLPMPKEVVTIVTDFQKGYQKDLKNDETIYRQNKDVHDEFTVTFKNSRTKQCVEAIEDTITNLKKGLYGEVLKTLSTYSKMDYAGFNGDKQMFQFEYYDMMGTKKKQEVRAVKVLEELKKMLSSKTSLSYDKNDLAPNYVFKVELTNKLMNKAKALLASERIGTCQRKSNCSYDGLAEGAVDFITNSCNIPLLIYNNDGEIIGRSLCRLFYNRDMSKEYLYVDRLYCTGQAANNRQDIYIDIIKTLIGKGYKVMVGDYLAHEGEGGVKGYLDGDKDFKFIPMKNIYRQPKRKLASRCGYYHDGPSKTMAVKGQHSKNPEVYDATVKGRIYSVKLK